MQFALSFYLSLPESRRFHVNAVDFPAEESTLGSRFSCYGLLCFLIERILVVYFNSTTHRNVYRACPTYFRLCINIFLHIRKREYD